MRTYIWTLAVIFSLGALVSLRGLASGEPEKASTPSGIAFRIAMQVGFIAWAVWLLAEGA